MDIFTEEEAAGILKITADYLYRLRVGKPRRRGQTPQPPAPRHFRVGGKVLYREKDLHAWIRLLAYGQISAPKRGRPRRAIA